MQRKIEIYCLIIISLTIGSCSVGRKVSVNKLKPAEIGDYGILKKGIENNNISESSFIISKFRARIKGDNITDRSVNGFLKYDNKGKILVSLRSMAGIEVARLLIARDSIKIYDKINKVLYLQDNAYLKMKYGLDYSHIELLWGDLPIDSRISFKKAGINTEAIYAERGTKIKYTVDKNYLKIALVLTTNNNSRLFEAGYEMYEISGKYIYPGKVTIVLPQAKLRLELDIKEINFDAVKSMNFKVDNKVEKIILK